MKLAFVAILVVLATVSTQAEGKDHFYDKVNAISKNVMCLGDGFYTWINLVERAMKKCYKDAHEEFSTSSRRGSYDQYYRGSAGRYKRHITEEKVMKLQKKIEMKVFAFRCIMQELKITGRDNYVDPASLSRQYTELTDIPRSLKNEIDDAIYTCHEASKCLPENKDSDLMPYDVKRTKFFLKCEKMFRYEGCLKETIKPFLGAFDFDALDGKLDHMEDDESRAVAIMKTAEKLGLDDFDLLL